MSAHVSQQYYSFHCHYPLLCLLVHVENQLNMKAFFFPALFQKKQEKKSGGKKVKGRRTKNEKGKTRFGGKEKE